MFDVQIKREGSSFLYDPEGFDYDASCREITRLRRKWWQTKRVKREIKDLSEACAIYLNTR